MKLKTKLYIVIGALVVACLCLLANSLWVGSKVDYHKGRADQALEDLEKAEASFGELKEQDAALQQEKDEEIARLEEEVTEVDQVIVYKEKEIVVTREMLKASGLYDGLVKELDEKWASKYSSLEGKLAKREKQIKEWEEKFASKVKLEVEGWVERDKAQKKTIAELQGLCKAQGRALKRSKFWAKVGKVWTGYHAVKGGIGLAKEIL